MIRPKCGSVDNRISLHYVIHVSDRFDLIHGDEVRATYPYPSCDWFCRLGLSTNTGINIYHLDPVDKPNLNSEQCVEAALRTDRGESAV